MKTFKDYCSEVAKKHNLGNNLVTGHKYSYFEEAAEIYAAQPKLISERPAFNEECLVICANEIRGEWDYALFQIKFVEHEEKHYMGWLTADGEEYGDLADLTSQLYYVMPLLPTPPEK